MASAFPRLHRAAARGEIAKVTQYLTAGDPVDARDFDARTALYYAVCEDRINCVEVLLAAGADPSASDNRQYFPLYVAARNENIAIATALVRADANINAICDHPKGGTALYVAVFKGNAAIVKLLLDGGCDTSRISMDGQYPLTDACMEGHIDILTMLLDAGADVSAVSSDGVTALIAAAQKGSLDVIEILLKRGADVNQQNTEGTAALHAAAYYGIDEAISVLVAAGADANRTDSTGGTPLHVSAVRGHPKCVYALLRAGANVSARDNEGSPPLHLAAEKGFTNVIEVLLSGGAQTDVNLEDDVYRTSLSSASAFADVRAVNLLLDAGADINQTNAKGTTALFFPSDLNIVKALLNRGADAKVLNRYRETVLHSAGWRGVSAGVICALFKGGADPTVENMTGETAADYARREGHEDTAKLLDLLAAKHRAMNST